jgi:hypothetical protein
MNSSPAFAQASSGVVTGFIPARRIRIGIANSAALNFHPGPPVKTVQQQAIHRQRERVRSKLTMGEGANWFELKKCDILELLESTRVLTF